MPDTEKKFTAYNIICDEDGNELARVTVHVDVKEAKDPKLLKRLEEATLHALGFSSKGPRVGPAPQDGFEG